MPVAAVLAQCVGAGPCDIPRGLPWWMSVAIAVLWLAAVVGAAVLLRRRLALRAARRSRERQTAHDRIERSTPGHDIEPG